LSIRDLWWFGYGEGLNRGACWRCWWWYDGGMVAKLAIEGGC